MIPSRSKPHGGLPKKSQITHFPLENIPWDMIIKRPCFSLKMSVPFVMYDLYKTLKKVPVWRHCAQCFCFDCQWLLVKPKYRHKDPAAQGHIEKHSRRVSTRQDFTKDQIECCQPSYSEVFLTVTKY